MNQELLAFLCLSQAVQGCVLGWMVVKVRRHDQVLTGLPGLIEKRDEAFAEKLAARFERATLDAIRRIMDERADEKARSDAASARQLMLLSTSDPAKARLPLAQTPEGKG